MREIMQKFALVGAICLGALTGAAATGKTEAFPVDLREGDRVSAGLEELTFSNLWDGDAEATVTIAQDGAAIFTVLSGEGVKTWTTNKAGRYELTHTTYTNGIKGKVETAVFVVEGKEVPVSELTIDWGQSSFVYDGQPKEPVIGVKHGEQSLTKDTDYEVSYLDNINVGTAKAIVKGIEPYVEAVTNAFTIVKGDLPPAVDPDPVDPSVDPDDPAQREDPDVRFSAFDYVGMYDGEAHTIDTNALKGAYVAALGAGVACMYARAPDGEWTAEPLTLKDVGVTSFWYRVTSANYDDVVKPCKVAITNRLVTLTSGTKTDFAYDGKPHAFTNLSVTAGSFVAGEGIATSNWATVTTVAEGEVANAFDYAPLAGTKLSNYDLTVVTGKIAVVAPPTSTVKVVLDAIGGKVQGKNVVTQEVNGVYGTLPDATRENYIFDGWFLGVSNASPQAISGGAVLMEGDHALFARWSYDPSVTPNPETIYKWETIDANTARITGFVNANQQLQKMILPEKIGGRFVTEIGASAFANTKCGVKELVLPMFCVVIDSKAFLGIDTLETITFAAARQWNYPSVPASVTIGAYAFSGAKALTRVMLCKEIASLGNYAFLNTRNLSSITILGKPSVGTQVFRSSGMDAGGVTIHLDPALASDAAYMAALKANMSNVTVKTDAIVTALTMSTLGMSNTSVKLTISVEKAAEWGQVNLGAIRVKYQSKLSEPATILTPTAATRNADGTVTLEIVPPEGTSGFLQTIIKE